MLSRALRRRRTCITQARLDPSGLTLENFRLAFDALNMNLIAFTLRIVLISTVFSTVSCSMAGYAIGRYHLKANKLLIGMAADLLVPMQTYIIPLFFRMKYFDFFGIGSLIGLFTGNPLTINLTNTEVPYYLLNALGSGLRSGIFILLFTQIFRGLPKELEDAARIDGAGEFRIFARIMVPNAASAFLVEVIMCVVWNWNDYFFPAILFQQNQFLSTKLSIMRQLATSMMTTTQYGDGLAETVIMYAGAFWFVLPMLVLYMFAQRFFLQSVERSGITG
ncbi:MAG: carbohydrate ABC transporter permease [Acutalibacteraceae bacterium]